MNGDPQLESPFSQDLADYSTAEQGAIMKLIDDDAAVRAQYFTHGSGDQPAQVIGASGFSQGINMAISPTASSGPI